MVSRSRRSIRPLPLICDVYNSPSRRMPTPRHVEACIMRGWARCALLPVSERYDSEESVEDRSAFIADPCRAGLTQEKRENKSTLVAGDAHGRLRLLLYAEIAAQFAVVLPQQAVVSEAFAGINQHPHVPTTVGNNPSISRTRRSVTHRRCIAEELHLIPRAKPCSVAIPEYVRELILLAHIVTSLSRNVPSAFIRLWTDCHSAGCITHGVTRNRGAHFTMPRQMCVFADYHAQSSRAVYACRQTWRGLCPSLVMHTPSVRPRMVGISLPIGRIYRDLAPRNHRGRRLRIRREYARRDRERMRRYRKCGSGDFS